MKKSLFTSIETPEVNLNTLVDSYGRKIRKLRISLTDKCNLRCHYCMPLDATFMDEQRYLSVDDYAQVVEDLCKFGLEEVRITGGEPLLRKSFKSLVEKIGSLPLKKIGLTTNAVLLHKYIEDLLEHRVHHINISLDSLNEDRFNKITRSKNFKKVLENISLAKSAGLNIKINTVLMKGVNDDEIFDFIEFSRELEIPIRFLEFMRIGHGRQEQEDQFISAPEIIKNIKKKYEMNLISSEIDSTSVNYRLCNGAEIGFIASESMPFCGHCSRWRLSCDGMIKACLLKSEGLSIKGLESKEREEVYYELLGMKPFLRPKEVSHQMNSIGG